ncbi:hypothetical protein RB195_020876 [Necator americanus]|uniref:Uncharacterized protein n=1 Tax=Necator americanus TaxID=51031 RepID=A0ABR1CKZ9_NECAM
MLQCINNLEGEKKNVLNVTSESREYQLLIGGGEPVRNAEVSGGGGGYADDHATTDRGVERSRTALTSCRANSGWIAWMQGEMNAPKIAVARFRATILGYGVLERKESASNPSK